MKNLAPTTEQDFKAMVRLHYEKNGKPFWGIECIKTDITWLKFLKDHFALRIDDGAVEGGGMWQGSVRRISQ